MRLCLLSTQPDQLPPGLPLLALLASFRALHLDSHLTKTNTQSHPTSHSTRGGGGGREAGCPLPLTGAVPRTPPLGPSPPGGSPGPLPAPGRPLLCRGGPPSPGRSPPPRRAPPEGQRAGPARAALSPPPRSPGGPRGARIPPPRPPARGPAPPPLPVPPPGPALTPSAAAEAAPVTRHCRPQLIAAGRGPARHWRRPWGTHRRRGRPFRRPAPSRAGCSPAPSAALRGEKGAGEGRGGGRRLGGHLGCGLAR